MTVYRGRPIAFWIIAISLWGFNIAITGGIVSPLFFLIIITVVHYLPNPRKHRYCVALALLGIALVGPYVIDHILPGLQLNNYPLQKSDIVFLALGLSGILTHCLILQEYRPLDVSFLSSVGTSWLSSISKESAYRSILARGMRLYRADYGLVSIPKVDEKGKTTFRVLYRAGFEMDDPADDEQVLMPMELVKFTEEGLETQFALLRNIDTSTILPLSETKVVKTVFSFTLKRTRSDEVGAIVSVFYHKQRYSILPSSTYYLDILRAEGESVLAMLTYTAGYQELLRAKDLSEFCGQVQTTCNELVPSSMRPIKVKFYVSVDKPIVEGAINPVVVTLKDEYREKPRSIYVFTEMRNPDIAGMHVVTNHLRDVATTAVLRQRLQTEEKLCAADKGPIGLSNLEPPDSSFIAKIKEWKPESDVYAEHFEKCGFRVLWANNLMRSWNIRLNEYFNRLAEVKSSPTACVGYCYHHFNSPTQKSPCQLCPCLRLVKVYLEADTNERNNVAERVQVGFSHSPAGKMQMYRHFELSASLVLGLPSLTPPHAKPEQEISFIRETVIDRTLETEVLYIMTKAAKEVELFATHLTGSVQNLQNASSQVIDGMLQVAIEGLGRAFHATKAYIIRHDIKTNFAIKQQFVCAAATENREGREQIVAKELGILDSVYRSRQGVEQYFEKREMLFTLERSQNLRESEEYHNDVMSVFNSAKKTQEYIRPETTSDIQVASIFEVFGPCERIILVDIPFTSYIIVTCTGSPEDWERSAPGSTLLPRELEFDLCNCVGEMLGFLINAMKVAEQYADIMIATRVRELMHEMSFAFESFPQHAHTVRSFVAKAFNDLDKLVNIINKQAIKQLIRQWYRKVIKYNTSRKAMSSEDRLELEKAYKKTICNNQEIDVHRDIWFMLAASGVNPSEVTCLSDIARLPEDEIRVILEFMCEIASFDVAVQHIKDTDAFTRSVFGGLLEKANPADVNIHAYALRVMRLLGSKTKTENIQIGIPDDMIACIEPALLYITLKNYVWNAIEARSAGPYRDVSIIISATKTAKEIIVEVNSPPPIVPPEMREEIFEDGVSSKDGDRRGMGLYIVRKHLRRVGGDAIYREEKGLNVFQASIPIIEDASRRK
ncbi:MAG: hypothetical protein K9N55_10210 [Phycisphaerae bacterium]|nr:hypothetical protein [Phycisphaerae bacterium]